MSLLVLVGPTAAGKTAVALALSERVPIEVVSLDSVQVYRGLDIGSAKPTQPERERLPHHLIDLVDPDARFSAADWLRACGDVVAAIVARQRIPLVVGGTGLYWRGLTEGLAELPAADDDLRSALIADERAAPGTLHARLAAVDSITAARLAPRDTVRLVRALEVHALSGVPLSAHHAAQHRIERDVHTVVLDRPDDALRAAIHARALSMIERGLVQEAKALRDRFGAVRPLDAVGYKQALDETIAMKDLPTAITTATWQFARRQRTWFKKATTRVASQDAALQALLARLD